MDNVSPSLRPEGGGAGAAVEGAPGEGEADAARERWAPCGEAGCVYGGGGKGGRRYAIFKYSNGEGGREKWRKDTHCPIGR